MVLLLGPCVCGTQCAKPADSCALPGRINSWHEAGGCLVYAFVPEDLQGSCVCVCVQRRLDSIAVGRSGKSPVPPLPFTPFHVQGVICAFSPRLAQLHTCCWLWISILVTPLRAPSVGDNLEKSVRSENG